MDIEEHRPMVDGWFRLMKDFTIKENKVFIILKSHNVSLYFKKTNDGLVYDGWNTSLNQPLKS